LTGKNFSINIKWNIIKHKRTIPMDIAELEKEAKRIRCLVIETIGNAGAGHTGGSLSIVEIMTVLYFHTMKVDPENPEWQDRDRCILSKGHASPGWYCTLAEKGFFPHPKLKEFDRVNGILQGHPDMLKTPGVDMSGGSLGQGLSAGIGMALGGQAQGKEFYVYVILGDGELQEGQVWESAMYAGFHKISRLIAIVDYNKLQLTGRTEETLDIEPLADKWKSFGWEVIECNVHNIAELVQTIDRAKQITSSPVVILAHTVKGYGISFIADRVEWHAKAPDKEQVKQAMKELRGC